MNKWIKTEAGTLSSKWLEVTGKAERFPGQQSVHNLDGSIYSQGSHPAWFVNGVSVTYPPAVAELAPAKTAVADPNTENGEDTRSLPETPTVSMSEFTAAFRPGDVIRTVSQAFAPETTLRNIRGVPFLRPQDWLYSAYPVPPDEAWGFTTGTFGVELAALKLALPFPALWRGVQSYAYATWDPDERSSAPSLLVLLHFPLDQRIPRGFKIEARHRKWVERTAAQGGCVYLGDPEGEGFESVWPEPVLRAFALYLAASESQCVRAGYIDAEYGDVEEQEGLSNGD